MQGTEIKVGVTVTDGGSTGKVTNANKLLRKEIDGVTDSATKASVAVKSMAAPRATMAPKTSEAIQGASQAPQDRIRYDQARAAVGTGAAGRDFANQAQGLGGLVRVYATFAANIFAVSAAFEALNKAAQTDRLIQSLEKLSVSAGTNLKSVAKNLQEASGQALSFGEAVQFTNIGTTAGLAGQQIESLTKIARGAATVLGRDVGDSIRRIIQGTAKQEQEILDELGIFLKANQAYEKYAQTFNIKVDDLTAQQKTQAYANEVERLGQKFIEFSEIPDPFTKFTATGKNALNSLLTTINKAVEPVLELFASSEGAIKATIGLISTVLIRQALPQLATALSELFTFDKAKINAEAVAANKILEDKYIETTGKLQLLKKQRDLLLVPEVTADTLSAAVGSSALTRGKGGQQGLSVQRLSTALLKDDELSKAKKLEDVEKSIANVLKEQVRDTKDKEAKLDALIQKGLISKDSTIQEVKLGKESEQIAKTIFAQITAQNVALAEQLAIEKSISVVEKERAALSKTISDAPKPKKSEFKAETTATDASATAVTKEAVATQASTVATQASTAATQANTVAKTTQNAALKESIGLRASYTAGLAVAATAETALTSAMAGGLLPTLKATGIAMKAAFAETLALAGGATILNASAILAGGGIKILSLGLKGLIATLNIILIPIMLVVTAWELFGDKLLNLLPNTLKVALGMDEASKSADKLADKLKDVAEGAGLAGLAQENLNKSIGNISNWSEQAAAANKQAKIIRDSVKASEELVEQREKEIAQLTVKQRQEEAAKSGVVFSERSFGAEQLAASNLATKQQSEELKRLAADWYYLDSLRKSSNMSNAEYNKQAIELGNRETVIKKELLVTAEQNAAAIGKVVSASQNLEELSDKIAKKSKEIKNVSLGLSDSDVVTWYEKIQTLNNAVSSSGTRVEDLKTLHDNLKKAVVGSTKAQEEAAPVIAILNTLMSTTDVDARKAAWEQLKDTVLKTTGSVAKALENSAKPVKIEEYSAEARKALIKFKSDVTETGLALRRLDIEISNTQALNARKDALLGYSSEASIAAEKQQQENKNNLQYTNSLAKAEEEYQRIILKRTATKEEKVAAKTAKTAQGSEAKLTKTAADQTAEIAAKNKAIESAITKSNKEFEQRVRLNSELVAKSQAELSLETTKLDILKQQGILTETQVVERSSALDARKTEAQFSQEKDTAELERQRAIAELKIKAAAITGGMASPEAVANELLIQSIYKNKINLATTANTLAKETSAINNENALSQAKWNDLLKESNSLAQSLGQVFGTFGTALGDAILSMVNLAKTQEDNDKRILAAKAKLAEYEENDDSDAKKKALKDLTKAEKARTTSEIDGMAQVAGNTKKMFKEKTAAYKAFSAVEKTLHVISMAIKVKEMIQDGISLATKIATNGAGMASDVVAAGVSGVKAVVSAITGPFPMNLIAGAATAAVIAGLLGSIGGSSPKVGGGGFVPNAEQRQETQGTAMSYNSEGKKVQTSRGVFGDTEAKSESIANSLEILKDNSVDGLSYDNRMLALLTSIDQGINKSAKSLYSIPGLTTGSMFGTVEGKQGGGFLRGSTTRNISDSGILIEGTFAQLASDTNKGVLDFFEQVTVSKKNWLGRTRTWTETYRKEVDDTTSDFFKTVFGDARDLFIEVGKLSDVSSGQVNAVLEGMNLSTKFVSLRGLKGEAFQKELASIISSVMDDASLAIFGSFEQYSKFGEAMTETAIRVVDSNQKINQALSNIGLNVNLTKLFSVTEALAEGAGGLDKFLQQAEYFRENFQTEAQRLAPTQKAVIKQLAAMGYASVDTKDEFRALVQSLNLTDATSQRTYQSLMDLAPGFNTVIEGITDGLADTKAGLESTISSFGDFAKNIKTFRQSLVLSASSTATPLEKYAQAKTQFESTYALALAGDKDAMGKVTSSAQTVLDLGKSLYASSDEYSNLFNYISEKLGYVEINALASVDVAQLQLNALDSQVSILTKIEENTAAMSGIPKRAGGGYASGWTMVGELGPEIVNFSNPAQVYTADQTAGMFAPGNGMGPAIGAMVTEIKQLREEVSQLRKDQQRQTGDLIISNYDANQKASEEIATAVVESSQETAWTMRSKAEIK